MAIVRRLYNQYRSSNPYEVEIRGNVVIGASGAVGAQTGLGFSVVKEVGTGTYTITLDADHGLIELYDASADVVNNTARLNAHITALNLATGVFTVLVTDEANTLTNPSSAARLCFRCVVKNKDIKF